MSLFKIFKGKSTDLGNDTEGKTTTTHLGYAYFTPDDGKFYIDITNDEEPVVGKNSIKGANRICINPDEEFFILDCGNSKEEKAM